MEYDKDFRRLVHDERVAQLMRDAYRARDDRRRTHRLRDVLRRLLGAAAHRRAGQMQPARR